MSEWKKLKLGEIAELRSEKFTPNNITSYPYIGLEHIEPKSLRINGIGVSNDVSSQKSIFYSDDILYGKLRPYFQKVYYPTFKGVCSTDIFVVKPKNVVHPKYLFYLLASDEFTALANQGSTGTRMPRADWKHLVSTEWDIPNLQTQTAIVEILSSLDDKIELNNKINQELETLAQTLFKQWFIDFEFPNENGEPYKSSGGEMVDSELGEIPKGWSVGYLNQIAELHKKNIKPFENPDTIYFHYSLPEYDVSKMPKNELGDKILSSKYEVVEHSVLVSKLNPITPRIWPIFKPNKNSICSTEFQVLKPLSVQFFPFLYCLCSSKDYTSSLQSRVTGTSGSHQRVNPKDMIDYEMVLPSTSIVNNFYDFLYDSLKMIQENRQEIVKLTKLRDTLLPKLISGELEINEISI